MLPTAFANLSDERLPPLFQEAGYTGWPGLIAMLAAMVLHLFEFVATQRFLRDGPHRNWRIHSFSSPPKSPATAADTAVTISGGTEASVDAGSTPVSIEKIQELYGTDSLYGQDRDLCDSLEDERRNPYFNFHKSNYCMDGFRHGIPDDNRCLPMGHSHGDDIVLVNRATRQAAALEAQTQMDMATGCASLPCDSPPAPQFQAELTLLRDQERRTQAMNLYILEFGIALHSVIIGVSLGTTTGSDFFGLFIAMLFHQFFEGVALGGRITALEFGLRSLRPWLLSAWFACSTPLGVAIGIAIRFSYDDESVQAMIVQGSFDACSAGILLYTSLVQLMAAEMTSNQGFRQSSAKNQIRHFVALWCGAAAMAILGKWA